MLKRENLKKKASVAKASKNSENGYSDDMDLAASDTSSDDEEVDVTNTVEDAESKKPQTTKPAVLEKLENKYKELQGKQLFIRFPYKLPEDEEELNKKIKTISPLVTKIHRPRQKHARFCLIDFESKAERDAAFKAIKKIIEKNDSMKKFSVSLPRTEKVEFVKEILDRKQKALEIKKAKTKLKHQMKAAARSKTYTSSIVIINLPATATVSEIRELFPHAVDIRIRPTKSKSVDTTIATVSLPTTTDVTKAMKKKFSLNGTDLLIRISKDEKKKSKNKKLFEKKKNQNSRESSSKFSKVLQ